MPSNLRILKKLSKRAAPLLARLGDHREQFLAAKGENYVSIIVRDKKHWDRSRCHPTYDGLHGDILLRTRKGTKVVMSSPDHPLKNTVMVGAVEGYFEPEWTEETAWESLLERVHGHFTEWSHKGPVVTRHLRTPSEVFQAAHDILAAGRKKTVVGTLQGRYNSPAPAFAEAA